MILCLFGSVHACTLLQPFQQQAHYGTCMSALLHSAAWLALLIAFQFAGGAALLLLPRLWNGGLGRSGDVPLRLQVIVTSACLGIANYVHACCCAAHLFAFPPSTCSLRSQIIVLECCKDMHLMPWGGPWCRRAHAGWFCTSLQVRNRSAARQHVTAAPRHELHPSWYLLSRFSKHSAVLRPLATNGRISGPPAVPAMYPAPRRLLQQQLQRTKAAATATMTPCPGQRCPWKERRRWLP